jgi:GT2 family glycosyltransferase
MSGQVQRAPDVAVVVVTFNSAGVLPGLLDSVPAAMGELTWHLVVVDNDSADSTVEVARAWSVRLDADGGAGGRGSASVVVTGRNGGYAAGVNVGLAEVPDAGAALVLNPDVRLAPGCVPTLHEALGLPGVGIAVPRLEDADGDLIFSLRREPSLVRALADAVLGATLAGRIGGLGEVVTDPRAYESARAADWAEGSTQLLSGECLRACGAWDESFFLYSEETDFHLRAREAGLGVRYVPTALAVHLEGDSGTSPRLWALLVANRLRLHARRHGRLAAVPYWSALLLREATRALRGDAIARAAVRVLLSPRMLWADRGPDWVARV